MVRLAALVDSDERDVSKPFMRPGIYLLALPTYDAVVFYWPEKGTWTNDAVKNVVSNRVTFMR